MMRSVIDRKFERRLAGLVNSGERSVLRGGKKGVEKESLRVTPAGEISQARHPRGARRAAHQREHHHRFFRGADRAGHSAISRDRWELLQYLCDIHQFVYRHLGRPAAVVDEHARRVRGRCGHPARAVRRARTWAR